MSSGVCDPVGGLVWERVSQYAMKSGEYRCAKVFIDGCTMYVLYHPDKLLKHCECFSEAQVVAAEHAGASDAE